MGLGDLETVSSHFNVEIFIIKIGFVVIPSWADFQQNQFWGLLHFYKLVKEGGSSRYNSKPEEAIDGVPLSLGSTLICLPTHC
jgi:hypothetical protein